jgi:hypothetical protein
MKGAAARSPSVRTDASVDSPAPTDLPAPDLARDSFPDAPPEAGPEARPDDLPRLPPDLGPDTRDVGFEVPRDFGPDLADLAVELPRDLGPEIRDVALEVPVDLGPGQRDLASERVPDLADIDFAIDLRRDFGTEVRDLALERPRDLASDRTLALDLTPAQDAGLDFGGQRAATVCTPGENYILVLSTDDELFRFYPDTLAMVRIGAVACGTPARPLNSLTVSPLGPAYISTNEGELCVVDPTTFEATPTPFDATAISNKRFGMAVVPANVPAGQTLYIAVKSDGDTLARVDLSSYAMTTLGPLVLRRDGGSELRPQVELTAGSNGELYGFSIGSSESLLMTIDPTTGVAIDVSQVPAGADAASYALVDWHGTIYLFLGSQNDTVGCSVYTYHKGDAAALNVGTLGVDILGAGVALCH